MWIEARKVISKIKKLYADDNRFIDGECNCDACVADRIGKESSELFDRLYKFFPKHLRVFQYSNQRFKSAFQALGLPHQLLHLSQQEKAMEILDSVAKENSQRAKRIPKTRLEVCRDCGLLVNKTLVKSTMNKEGKEEYICGHCITHYGSCTFCDHLHEKELIHNITFVTKDGNRDRAVACDVCFATKIRQCAFCGDFHSIGESTDIQLDGRGPQPICHNCRETRIKKCSECGMEMYVNDSRASKKLLCHECRSYKKDILSWNFRPRPVFLINEDKEKQFKDTLFFGVELEIEKLGRCQLDNSQMSRAVRKIWPFKHVYCVHDGSLESGFEIVSQPFTWSRHMKDRPLWEDTFICFDKYGYSTGPRAGMHVHMSKAAFTTVHLYKFVNFLYKESTRQFLQAVAGRKLGENQYCKFDKGDVENTAKLAKHKDNMSADKHHSAVNLENNATIETRIFAMPANFEGMYKNLEFMHALYVFSKESKYKDMVVNKFLEFLTEPQHRGRYRNLVNFLKGNAYLKKSFPAYYKKL